MLVCRTITSYVDAAYVDSMAMVLFGLVCMIRLYVVLYFPRGNHVFPFALLFVRAVCVGVSFFLDDYSIDRPSQFLTTLALYYDRYVFFALLFVSCNA